jgi:hypothetical protein
MRLALAARAMGAKHRARKQDTILASAARQLTKGDIDVIYLYFRIFYRLGDDGG